MERKGPSAPSPFKVCYLSFPEGPGDGSGDLGASGPRGFLPFSGGCKDAPAAEAERRSAAAGAAAAAGGGGGRCRAPDMMTPRVLTPWFRGPLHVPRLAPAASWEICQLSKGLPLGGGAPLIESAPKTFLGPHPKEGSSTRLRRPACAGESDEFEPPRRSEARFTPLWNGHNNSPYRPG